MHQNFFNIADAAQGYSQLCGVMAGFSFAVLVWLVERLNLKDADTKEDVLVIRGLVYLGITFLGNLLVSFYWALIAGEAGTSANRPQGLAYIASWLMALLAPMMMQAMTLVVATTTSQYAVKLFRRIYFVTAIIGLVFLWTETSGIQMVYRGKVNQPFFDPALTVVQVASYALALVGFIICRRPYNQRFGLDTENSFANYTTGFLAATLLSGMAFGSLAIASPTTRLWDIVFVVANLAWAGMLFWSTLFLPRE